MNTRRCVFVTGGTGYLGRPLIAALLDRGHEVRALVRPGSEDKLPTGCTAIVGDALDFTSYVSQIRPAETFVQLVGVSHPSPSKAAQFRAIDLASGQGAIQAAVQAGIPHFVYLSVAHPAPVMKVYIEVRMECEALLRQTSMNVTIVSSLVRARTGSSLALFPDSGLLGYGAHSDDSRWGPQAWPGYFGADDALFGSCRRKSLVRQPNRGSARNPRCWLVSLEQSLLSRARHGSEFQNCMPHTKSNCQNYESACPWDICSLKLSNEMLSWS